MRLFQKGQVLPVSIFRSPAKVAGAERPSLLIEIRMIDKLDLPLDAHVCWSALQLAFKDHPHLRIEAATIRPDKGGKELE